MTNHESAPWTLPTIDAICIRTPRVKRPEKYPGAAIAIGKVTATCAKPIKALTHNRPPEKLFGSPGRSSAAMPRWSIRAADANDESAWRALWDGYCAFYGVEIPGEVTATTWARVLDPGSAVASLLAFDGERALGFANYVVHPYTWGTQPACYLEDLFVAGEARGAGAGGALIAALLALGRAAGWGRLYWMTREGNATARRLYDRFAERDDFVRYVVPLDRGD